MNNLHRRWPPPWRRTTSIQGDHPPPTTIEGDHPPPTMEVEVVTTIEVEVVATIVEQAPTTVMTCHLQPDMSPPTLHVTSNDMVFF